jgi:hypothetical protein
MPQTEARRLSQNAYERRRYATDPEWRAKRLAAKNARRVAKKGDSMSSNGAVAVEAPAGPGGTVGAPAVESPLPRGPGRPPGPPRDAPPKGRQPPGKTLTQTQRTMVRGALRQLCEMPNMAFTFATMTGAPVDPRYYLAPQEMDRLADVWADVIALYPDTLKWFEQGNKLSVWSVALFTTSLVVVPRLGLDLAKPSGLRPVRQREGIAADGHAVAAGPVPPDAAPDVRDTAGPPGGAADPAGGARPDGGDHGLWQNDPGQIAIGAA